MLFSTFTVLFTYATFGLLQFASATPLLSTKDMMVKRDNAAAIYEVLNTLKTEVAVHTSTIRQLSASNTTTQEDAVAPLTGITTALNKAAASLTTIPASELLKRQTGDELADPLSGIINDIVDALQGLVDNLGDIALLAGLLTGIDVALNQVLIGLGILLKGVLNLVAQLLVNIAALLRNLAFGLSLGTLGL
ncbi:hypothetical protein BDV93DRAFT_545940 [Ceratobasidium sp. AG-I]|nr:hypothetical protein BDV93DRAFT_545940 [Ceratobasidium sp. AG-I]